jgi:hypothetical protein
MWFLTTERKQQCVNVYEELTQIASNDATFLCKVITSDMSWIYGYDLETKQQSSQWKTKGKIKSMHIVFFDIKGIVRKEFIWQAINQFHTLLSRFMVTA